MTLRHTKGNTLNQVSRKGRKTFPVSGLKRGTLFMHKDAIYIVTTWIDTKHPPAVNLRSGEWSTFSDDNPVEPLVPGDEVILVAGDSDDARVAIFSPPDTLG